MIEDQNFEISQGEIKSLSITVFLSDQTTPMPITGADITWVAWRMGQSGSPSITKTTGAGSVIIEDGPNGVCSVSFLEADTATLEPGVYRHELQVVKTGLRVAVLRGDMTIILNPLP